MEHFINIVFDKKVTLSKVEETVNSIASTGHVPLNESGLEYEIFKEGNGLVVSVPLNAHIDSNNVDQFVNEVANKLFDKGYNNFDIELSLNENQLLDEETYDGNDFYEAYGDLWFNEDEELDEAEYQGRKVKLGKPMQGDVKKFKVYVKNPKGNVVKVNFGDPDMRIKKSNPARRKSFRARHNCDNPGPRHKARFWSCKKW